MTTISCDARIFRCSRCAVQVVVVSATAVPGTCTCGAAMVLDRSCDRSFALRRDVPLLRCIAENKEGWRCGDDGDLCPDHAHRVELPRASRAQLQETRPQ